MLPLPLRIVASTPFTIRIPSADGGPSTNFCFARAAEGKVLRWESDTLHFAELRSTLFPLGSSDCAAGGPAYVALSEAPGLEAERHVTDPVANLLGALALLPLSVLVMLAIM